MAITTTYAGEFADKYLRASVLSAPSADNLTVVSGFGKDTIVFGKITDAFALDNFSCTWVGGSTDLSEVTIPLIKLQVQRDICKTDFEVWWENQKLGASEHNMTFQAMTYSDALLAAMVDGISSQIETQIWQGTGGADDNTFKGLITTLTADATVVDVVGTTVTATNVIEELGKVLAVIPDAVYEKRNEDLGIYAPIGVIKAYRSAMAALGYLNMYHDGEAPLNFEGVNLIEAPGMTANHMVAARKSNLFVGTSLKDDWNKVAIKDMEEVDLTENVRLSAKFKISCNHGIGADCVLYTPA